MSQQSQSVDVAGVKLVSVKVTEVRPNPWNPNIESPEIFERTKRSIQKHGFVDPIMVRTIDGTLGYEIVDGEHRWRAAGELGLSLLPAVNLGPISDDEAKRLTLLSNELRGEPEPAKLARVLQDLAKMATPEELSFDLPMQMAEIDALIKAADFTWQSLNPEPEKGRTVNTGAEDRRFVLGSIQGHVPTRLCDGLISEFKKSSAAISSNNIELVLKDMLARLKASPPAKKVKDAKAKPAKTEAAAS